MSQTDEIYHPTDSENQWTTSKINANLWSPSGLFSDSGLKIIGNKHLDLEKQKYLFRGINYLRLENFHILQETVWLLPISQGTLYTGPSLRCSCFALYLEWSLSSTCWICLSFKTYWHMMLITALPVGWRGGHSCYVHQEKSCRNMSRPSLFLLAVSPYGNRHDFFDWRVREVWDPSPTFIFLRSVRLRS